MQNRVAAERKAKGYKWFIDFDELSQDLQDDINNYRKEVNKTWLPGGITPIKGRSKLQDGIIRPDGQVTQIAPDDWVFAARNLGDLARAFIPQNKTTVSRGEYTINQTFNISGSNDMPQVLRQQAYRGTQEGLLEIMNDSSRRMQLMSGVR
jgi:hypothetical protein